VSFALFPASRTHASCATARSTATRISAHLPCWTKTAPEKNLRMRNPFCRPALRRRRLHRIHRNRPSRRPLRRILARGEEPTPSHAPPVSFTGPLHHPRRRQRLPARQHHLDLLEHSTKRRARESATRKSAIASSATAPSPHSMHGGRRRHLAKTRMRSASSVRLQAANPSAESGRTETSSPHFR